MHAPSAPLDPATRSGSTEQLEAIDRPLAEAGAPSGPLAPGRYLLVEEGGSVRAVALTRQVTHLGRGFAATLQLEDAGVSRRHAIVVQRRGGVRVLDDRSANGTWVNGRRVLEAELRDGDAIMLGRTVLVYRERSV
ncbi:MAG: FHA domain-containing protein [Actinobacteria bacterium]|nr:FHA domain-containing protein [Actinomycetota bacterium]